MTTPVRDRSMDLPAGYLSLREAARWACVPQRTPRRWIGKGLRMYQAERRGKVFVRADDITDFLTRTRVPMVDLNRLVDEVLQTLA